MSAPRLIHGSCPLPGRIITLHVTVARLPRSTGLGVTVNEITCRPSAVGVAGKMPQAVRQSKASNSRTEITNGTLRLDNTQGKEPSFAVTHVDEVVHDGYTSGASWRVRPPDQLRLRGVG